MDIEEKFKLEINTALPSYDYCFYLKKKDRKKDRKLVREQV